MHVDHKDWSCADMLSGPSIPPAVVCVLDELDGHTGVHRCVAWPRLGTRDGALEYQTQDGKCVEAKVFTQGYSQKFTDLGWMSSISATHSGALRLKKAGSAFDGIEYIELSRGFQVENYPYIMFRSPSGTLRFFPCRVTMNSKLVSGTPHYRRWKSRTDSALNHAMSAVDQLLRRAAAEVGSSSGHFREHRADEGATSDPIDEGMFFAFDAINGIMGFAGLAMLLRRRSDSSFDGNVFYTCVREIETIKAGTKLRLGLLPGGDAADNTPGEDFAVVEV